MTEVNFIKLLFFRNFVRNKKSNNSDLLYRHTKTLQNFF